MIPKLLGIVAVSAGCILLFMAALKVVAMFVAMGCEARWAESYEWKYERPYCKIKIDGKWIPEEYFRVDRR